MMKNAVPKYGFLAPLFQQLGIPQSSDNADFLKWDDTANTGDGLGGDDLMKSFGGDDTLSGGLGNDTVWAGDGNDLVHGDAGDDSLRGGWGDDSVDGGTDNDVIVGGLGVDTLQGGDGDDSMFGGASGDIVNGGAGNDTLDGQGGADSLDGGTGADVMIGGRGNDVFWVDDLGDQTIEENHSGEDVVRSSISWTLSRNVERLVLVGSADLQADGNRFDNFLEGNSGHNLMYGHRGNDILVGAAGDDTLYGNQGSDVIDGGLGNDWLIGGIDDDKLQGGAGDDSYWVDSAQDVIYEALDEGTDTVYTTANWTLGDNQENAVLMVEGLTVVGNSLNNHFTGSTGNDNISASGGNDWLEGGTGNDTLIGGTGSDTLIGGAGDDVMAETTSLISEHNTFVCGVGQGNDIVFTAMGARSSLQIQGDIDPTLVGVSRVFNDLLLTLPDGADSVRLKNFFLSSTYEISSVSFDDGTTWSNVDLRANVLVPTLIDHEQALQHSLGMTPHTDTGLFM